MRGEHLISEASVDLLNDRIRKATRKVKRAARGDADGVHDLRVAIRKVRAALSVMRETLLDDDVARKYEKRLARVFSALGDVRDHDVMVERVMAMAKGRVTDKGAKVVSKELDARCRRAKKRLRAAMRKDDPVRLLENVGGCVARAVADASRAHPDRDDHRSLVRHRVGSVLVRRFELVLSYELVMPASIDVMHCLRIAMKKLRYALDFFSGALGAPARALDRALQKAQDELGELHDHHVAREVVAVAVQRSGSKRSLEALRDAEDALAEKLLAKFAGTWHEISGGAFSTTLLTAVGHVLGPAGVRQRRLALRRAEPA